LAKVFRAKLLSAIREEELELPARYPETRVVDCKAVGSGDKALVYLDRYLYKGVIQEKDVIACGDGQMTFRYQDSKTNKEANPNAARCPVPRADITTCVAQGLSAHP